MTTLQRIVLIGAIVVLIGGAVALDGSENLLGRTIALSSIFTGLLTLTGFLFTARTFITFKLNEVVYGHPDYRARVERFQGDGAYSQALYEPLKEIDTRVGKTCIWVFGTMLSVLAFSMLPRDWSKLATSVVDCYWGDAPPAISSESAWRFVFYQIATAAVFCTIVVVAVEVFVTILSVNRNIRAIITEWEDRYKKDKAEKEGASPPL